ncbi:cytochrome P450 CYP82D47-like [Humulus lupulus]|uniref:cytochrome P450 CYP82D47-like n=1 Tax=Humulus lupulus TaxID=3486 RepID=UPI002B4147C5|nr:cytochrome P450 CYP82D47-like [Humulus lupulus]
MDFPSLFAGTATIFAAFLFLYLLLWKPARRLVHSQRNPPEAAGAWPIIGHLHLLSGPEPPFKTLGQMADKYGPIFTIRMGVYTTLVVSSWGEAKECLTTNDKAFANRPKSIASEILTYNYAMIGFSPYGSYWRHARKMATLELLSNQRLEILSHVRQSEVKASIKEVYELCLKNKFDQVVEMKEWFGDITLNVVFRMVVGKRYLEATSSGENDVCNRSEQYRKALREFFEFTGTFMVSDAIPYLAWLDLGGYEKAMKKTAKELDELAQVWIEEHKRKRVDHKGELVLNNKEEHDFMDVMLSILDDAELGVSSYDADTINKALSLALILGGTDTTTVTMTWALALLLNNRDCLTKAQEELDQHVGRDRQVEESDLKKLVYLRAIIKETMRLYPAAPLALPHEAVEDCTVSGYHVRTGTRLLVNISKLHRDPKVWAEPNEFRPERFMTGHLKNIDVRGQNFELMPFGSGRRMCPAVSFALQVLQLTLASLLQGFEIATPLDEPVDMRESAGLTNLKDSPLNVILTPRLPAEAYY